MQDYCIIALLGALVALDTTVAGQFMISQPIVSAALAGLLFGELESAVYVGAIMQVMWLKLVPAGGTIFLNGNLGTITAVSVLALCLPVFPYSIEGLQFTVILYGIVISYVYGYFTYKKRLFNQIFITYAHRALEENSLVRFQLCHFTGVVVTGIAGAVLVLSFSLVGSWIVRNLPNLYFTAMDSYFVYGLIAFLGIGLGTTFSMVWQKEFWYYAIIGVFAGIIILFL